MCVFHGCTKLEEGKVYIKEDNLQEKPGLKQLFENLLNVFEQRYDEIKTNKEKKYIAAKDIIDGFSDFMRVWVLLVF